MPPASGDDFLVMVPGLDYAVLVILAGDAFSDADKRIAALYDLGPAARRDFDKLHIDFTTAPILIRADALIFRDRLALNAAVGTNARRVIVSHGFSLRKLVGVGPTPTRVQ
jgi:hypothetical protein